MLFRSVIEYRDVKPVPTVRFCRPRVREILEYSSSTNHIDRNSVRSKLSLSLPFGFIAPKNVLTNIRAGSVRTPVGRLRNHGVGGGGIYSSKVWLVSLPSAQYNRRPGHTVESVWFGACHRMVSNYWTRVTDLLASVDHTSRKLSTLSHLGLE